MSAFAERLASLFLASAAPGDQGRSGEVSAPVDIVPVDRSARTPRAVAVLGRDAAATAGVMAATLARAAGTAGVVVLYRGSPAPPTVAVRPPAAPAAARLGERLVERGHAATAAGRVVVVELDADDRQAAAEAARAAAAAGDAPVVLAITGARTDALDALLERQDAVVLAPSEEAPDLTALAERALALRCPGIPVVAGAGRPDRRGRRALAQRVLAVVAGNDGQASVLLVAVLVAVVLGAIVLGSVARGLGMRSDGQRAADLAALAAGHVLLDQQDRLFEPPLLGGRPNPRHLEAAALRERVRATAVRTAHRNGSDSVRVTFPGGAGDLAPTRIRVEVRGGIDAGDTHLEVPARAEAEVAPPSTTGAAGPPGAGEYRGPFAERQGKRMRPDVAAAFDRMAATAGRAGLRLIIASAFRSDAEQGVLFAAHPDPKWVARPGTSLHRLGTELDLGPPAAYGWLAANAARFRFLKRYGWEPWHFGFVLNAGTRSVGHGGPAGTRADGERGSALPSFVPARFAPAIGTAAQRWNVSGALLAAQLWQESHFNPFARSGAGAQGIAQFMPTTAAAYGLRNPFDARAAIDAQAHLMRDLLRQFGAVPLALAAYNAGPVPVQRCMCVPPIPETRAYVAAILGLLGGAGDAMGMGEGTVRLVA